VSGRREIGAEIRELPEYTGDLATLVADGSADCGSGTAPNGRAVVWQ